MAELLELQNELLSMKCCLCEIVLSIPPIMVLSQDGTRLKCGRCKNRNDELSICRSVVFERMAKFISFPCIYNDCNEIIPWKDVESHEDACDKRTVKCPIYYQNCEENVRVLNLEEHLKRYHEDNIFYETRKYLTPTTSNMISFIMFKNYQFITAIKNSENSAEIYVASLKKINECFTYTLKLSSTCDDTFFAYENQPISKYDEVDHCLKCMLTECDLNDYPHTRVEDDVPVRICAKKVDLTAVKIHFGDIPDSEIRYSLSIIPTKEYEDNNRETSSDTATVGNIVDECLEKLKMQLQCPICMEYMISNIYNCDNGHVLCNNCRTRVIDCPTCRTNFEQSRNFPLENLADEIVFACIFSRNGCQITGKLTLLSQHEKECSCAQEDG
ncbi:unnamed protein product [Phaedon cochleariae]|uniref:RING-type domain-containing protein n=1 Tax=Phaedon cochleariae TaxID=80249 RepID=A0A9N9SNV1_PHACE|nr:unnamed protein product [Phaedon cochleariae]